MTDYMKRLDEILKSDACKCFAEAVEAVAIAKVLLKELGEQTERADLNAGIASKWYLKFRALETVLEPLEAP